MDHDPSLSPVFRSPNFLARKLTFNDLDDFHRLQSNPLIMRYATGKKQTLEENRKDLNNVISNYSDSDPDLWVYALEHLEDHSFIGTAGFSKMKHQQIEVGIRLLTEHWSKGYGKEILKVLTDFGFQYFDTHTLYGVVDHRNIASIKMLEHCGFIFQETRYNTSYESDEHIYRISNT